MGKVFSASCWKKAVNIEHSCGCQVTFQVRVRELCAPAQVDIGQSSWTPLYSLLASTRDSITIPNYIQPHLKAWGSMCRQVKRWSPWAPNSSLLLKCTAPWLWAIFYMFRCSVAQYPYQHCAASDVHEYTHQDSFMSHSYDLVKLIIQPWKPLKATLRHFVPLAPCQHSPNGKIREPIHLSFLHLSLHQLLHCSQMGWAWELEYKKRFLRGSCKRKI